MDRGRPAGAVAAPTVLVVDDHDQVRETLKETLEALGFAVEVAGDGDEALPLLCNRQYEAVVCDLVMPNLTGARLYELCRERDPQNAARFVFLSATSRGSAVARAAAATGQPYLSKPCEISALYAAITAVASRPGTALALRED